MKNKAMRQEAMKIMEALMGVDEELLARCEAGGGAGEEKRGWNKKKNLYMWRLSSCAALLCVFAIGALSWREFGKLSLKNEAEMRRLEGLSGAAEGMPENVSAPAGAVSPTSAAVHPDALLESTYGNVGAGDEGIAGSGIDEMNGGISMGEKSAGAQPGSSKDLTADYKEIRDGMQESVNREPTKQESFETDEQEKVPGVEACLTSPTKKLTEAEARQMEDFSSYIPSKLPEGYIFEEASLTLETGMLSLVWGRGMDSIVLRFQTAEGDETEIADISKPESYDQRLYEIPYGDKIPKEYWYTFQSPVFAKEDFSLEIVRSRVLSYSGDTGDTSTPRGNFKVLCDGVLISFDGRGTPEQIWDMFSSILE